MGNSQLIQIAKNSKCKRFTLREVYYRKKVEGVAGQPLANTSEKKVIQLYKRLLEITCVMLRHPQLSEQKPTLEMGWFRQNLGRDLLPNGRTTGS